MWRALCLILFAQAPIICTSRRSLVRRPSLGYWQPEQRLNGQFFLRMRVCAYGSTDIHGVSGFLRSFSFLLATSQLAFLLAYSVLSTGFATAEPPGCRMLAVQTDLWEDFHATDDKARDCSSLCPPLH